VRIISFALAFLLIFAGTLIHSNSQTALLKRKIVHKYQSAMEKLSSEMENISVTLGKTLYIGTLSSLNHLTNELILQTGTASAALAELPVKHSSMQTVSKFLNQVSNFAFSITQNVIKGQEISTDERKNLTKLSKIAKDLSLNLDEAKTLYNDVENWNDSIENQLNDIASNSNFDPYLDDAAEALSDYPTLIYDGPFSDHILEKESVLLESANEISEAEAKKTAAKALGVSAEGIKKIGEENGKIASFVFGFEGGTIAVTKKGGFISFFRKERDIKNTSLDYERAIDTAKRYINSLHLGKFKESYYFTDEGMCVINFSYLQGNTVCYSDLIKVGVALDTFEIVFYEASGYIMNHKARTLKVPLHTKNQAEKVISPHLKIKATNLALIPSSGKNELYCFEFLCEGEQKEEILVYVNTETLAEEQIFILLKTDGGTLTQ
jgi:germination protein YpeB